MVPAGWLVVVVFLFRNTFAYIEYVEISNCESCTLMLTCRHLNSVIAVFNATFEPFEANSTYLEDFRSRLPPVYPRLALNRRCSGVNHCSFILTKDCPGADRWGPGNFTVRYACVAERRITRYCNENITLPSPEVIGVSEGFIRNPGYPLYYLGRQECTWKIQAPPMQRVKITLLDLSLISRENPNNCLDLLEIKESENTVFASCFEDAPPKEIFSLGGSLEISLRASESIIARRGVLFHYTAVGCPTPESPQDGYLVYRNDTDALFSCCVGYVFPDSKDKHKDIRCLGHSWNYPLPLPTCINHTYEKNLSRDIKVEMIEESLTDIILPCFIIIVLFVINSIVIFVIYKYKKRRTALYTEEELGTMPVSSGK